MSVTISFHLSAYHQLNREERMGQQLMVDPTHATIGQRSLPALSFWPRN